MLTIAAYANDMSHYLKTSELTERRAFIESFVKEIVVSPGNAVVRYTIPMPDDSDIPGMDAEEVALHGSVLPTVHPGPPAGTPIGLRATLPTSQVLRKSPVGFYNCWKP